MRRSLLGGRADVVVLTACWGMNLPSAVRGYTTVFLKNLKSMKLALKTIIVVAVLSGFFCSSYAHESRQPTGLIAPNSDWKHVTTLGSEGKILDSYTLLKD